MLFYVCILKFFYIYIYAYIQREREVSTDLQVVNIVPIKREHVLNSTNKTLEVLLLQYCLCFYSSIIIKHEQIIQRFISKKKMKDTTFQIVAPLRSARIIKRNVSYCCVGRKRKMYFKSYTRPHKHDQTNTLKQIHPKTPINRTE